MKNLITARSDSSLGLKNPRFFSDHLYKHESTIEHLYYNFEIFGISRACLQELARHRIASYSVKSTRYTLKELLKAETYDDFMNFLVPSGNRYIDALNVERLRIMQTYKKRGVPNDVLKYLIPEAYKTHLHFSINARSLRNFLELRLSKSAHPEMRALAGEIADKIPESHYVIYEDILQDTTQNTTKVGISEYRGKSENLV